MQFETLQQKLIDIELKPIIEDIEKRANAFGRFDEDDQDALDEARTWEAEFKACEDEEELADSWFAYHEDNPSKGYLILLRIITE